MRALVSIHTLVTMICLPIGNAFADSRVYAEQLFEAIRGDETPEERIEQLQAMSLNQARKLGMTKAAHAAKRDDLMEILKEGIDFEKYRKSCIDEYNSRFDEEELKALAGFYSSDLGKKFLKESQRINELQNGQLQEDFAAIEPKLIEVIFAPLVEEDRDDKTAPSNEHHTKQDEELNEAENKLLGSWRQNLDMGMVIVSTYFSDRTSKSKIKYPNGKEINTTSEWKIIEDVFSGKIIDSEIPNDPNIGYTWTSKVLNLTSTRYEYELLDTGMTGKMERVSRDSEGNSQP